MPKPSSTPVPPGYHTVTPYIICSNASKAIDFYREAFGATEIMRMNAPDGQVMHAEIKIGDSHVMITDESPQMGARSPKHYNGSPVSMFMYVPDCDKAVARAVASGATVLMPPTDMFWGDRFAKLSDPFGHEWALATQKLVLTPDEMKQAAEKAFSQPQ